MVGGEVVGALVEHLVVEYRRVDGHLAADAVAHLDLAARLDEEADGVLLAGVDAATHLVGGERQRVLHLHARVGVVDEVGVGLASRLERLGGVEGVVCLPLVEQTAYVHAVDVAALRLPVRTVGAPFAHTLVDAYAEPCQRLVDVVFGSRHEAVAVGVLDAEYHVAPVLAGEQVVVERGAYPADVQRACGRRRESYSYLAVHCLIHYICYATAGRGPGRARFRFYSAKLAINFNIRRASGHFLSLLWPAEDDLGRF